jgi:hypothetical protein
MHTQYVESKYVTRLKELLACKHLIHELRNVPLATRFLQT